VDCIRLARDGDTWRAAVNWAMNVHVLCNTGQFLDYPGDCEVFKDSLTPL
jgi:hypothetical protein